MTATTPAPHSLMAERVAIARALHQTADGDPKIFTDPLALPIIGQAGERWMHENLAWLQDIGLRRTRAMVVIRARFNEDELQGALARGVTQYVMLGAGLDTFAYRRTDLASRLTVYEVDTPATQAWKRARLAEAGIGEPAHVRFVPVDFDERSLGECLAGAGFRRDQPSFFSWLGVTYYLTRDAVLDVLRFIGSQQPPSQVVFDFALDSTEIPPAFRSVIALINQYNAQSGEIWRTVFASRVLMAELRALGFTQLNYLDSESTKQRFLAGRSDGLEIGPLIGLMSARNG